MSLETEVKNDAAITAGDAECTNDAARQARIDSLKQLRRDNLAARDAISADLALRLERAARNEDQERNKSGMKFRVQDDALAEPNEHQEKPAPAHVSSDEGFDGDALVTARDLRVVLGEVAAVTGQADRELDGKIKTLEDRMALLERISKLEQDMRELRRANGIERESEGTVFALPSRAKNVA